MSAMGGKQTLRCLADYPSIADMHALDCLISSLPDSAAENEIASTLRCSGDVDLEATIFSILRTSDPAVRLAGLRIAKRVIRDKALAAKILKIGLEQGDAYEIRFWLGAVSPIIGTKGALKVVADYAPEKPSNVVRAWTEISALHRHPSEDAALKRVVDAINQQVGRLTEPERDYWRTIRT